MSPVRFTQSNLSIVSDNGVDTEDWLRITRKAHKIANEMLNREMILLETMTLAYLKLTDIPVDEVCLVEERLPDRTIFHVSRRING